MNIIRSHILRLATIFFLLFCTMGNGAEAQEIIMPERWEKAISQAKPLFRQDTLSICILGDVMMHADQIRNAHRNGSGYDFSSYFSLIGDRIRNADIAVANMEFTLAGEPYTGYPCFSAPDTLATYLAECGFDVFLAANNHIFDKGSQGAGRTIGIYRGLQKSHGIRFTGIAGNEDEMRSNNPLIIRAKGIKTAFINFTYGTNLGLGTYWPKTNYIGEKAKISDAFSRAEEDDADYIIALPHWGNEYLLEHSREQKDFAEWLVENGADFIIGAHPHVVQDYEVIEGVPTVYSLGNAVSNMSATNTQIGLMATIRIVRQGSGDLKVLPLELEYLWCSRPGGYSNSYTVIPVKEYTGRQNEWQNPADYFRMTAALERVSKETGIE